jgi:hypothetical protein
MRTHGKSRTLSTLTAAVFLLAVCALPRYGSAGETWVLWANRAPSAQHPDHFDYKAPPPRWLIWMGLATPPPPDSNVVMVFNSLVDCDTGLHRVTVFPRTALQCLPDTINPNGAK